MAQGEDVELAMSSAAQYIRIVAPFYLVVNVKVNADATVRGCNGNVGFMVSTFSDLIFRVGLVYVLTPFMGFARRGLGMGNRLGARHGCRRFVLCFHKVSAQELYRKIRCGAKPARRRRKYLRRRVSF